MMFLSKNWYFSVQKALIYYIVNKSHHNSFILLVFLHVVNFRYVANFRFLTLTQLDCSRVVQVLEGFPHGGRTPHEEENEAAKTQEVRRWDPQDVLQVEGVQFNHQKLEHTQV